VFLGGDAAFGPKNIIWRGQHGHDAACDPHALSGEDSPTVRFPRWKSRRRRWASTKWSVDNDVSADQRYRCRIATRGRAEDIRAEVELGYDSSRARLGAARPDFDIQTVFTAPLVHRMRRCVYMLPEDCLTFTQDAAISPIVRQRLKAPSAPPSTRSYVADGLRPALDGPGTTTSACIAALRDAVPPVPGLQKYLIDMTHAGTHSRPNRSAA